MPRKRKEYNPDGCILLIQTAILYALNGHYIQKKSRRAMIEDRIAGLRNLTVNGLLENFCDVANIDFRKAENRCLRKAGELECRLMCMPVKTGKQRKDKKKSSAKSSLKK